MNGFDFMNQYIGLTNSLIDKDNKVKCPTKILDARVICSAVCAYNLMALRFNRHVGCNALRLLDIGGYIKNYQQAQDGKGYDSSTSISDYVYNSILYDFLQSDFFSGKRDIFCMCLNDIALVERSYCDPITDMFSSRHIYETVYGEEAGTKDMFDLNFFSICSLCNMAVANELEYEDYRYSGDNLEELICILKERFVDHSISIFPDTDSGQVLDMVFETIADYFNECNDSCEPVLPELIFSLCSQIGFFLEMGSTAFAFADEKTQYLHTATILCTGYGPVINYLLNYQGDDDHIQFIADIINLSLEMMYDCTLGSTDETVADIANGILYDFMMDKNDVGFNLAYTYAALPAYGLSILLLLIGCMRYAKGYLTEHGLLGKEKGNSVTDIGVA